MKYELVSLLKIKILVLLFRFDNDNPNATEPLMIISRDDWNARPAEEKLPNLDLPSIRVIITDTETENCSKRVFSIFHFKRKINDLFSYFVYFQLKCERIVKNIQEQHMNWISYADIGYNFLIGGDNAAYVGRGWNIEGEHTPGCNEKSICISFIGTFDDEYPSKQQLDTAQQLIREGVKLRKLREYYNLFGQYQLKDTENPSKALYKIIQKWNHWTQTNQTATDICSTSNVIAEKNDK